ncbi:hypothetical protein [Duffyella gerundensis]|uniref:hypothetical protein n=1 Tax=Duffyella gerundensis TaxID=1619313 RepID=UPI001654B737|nr:hypothetical protein [Duffyella gerundensis]
MTQVIQMVIRQPALNQARNLTLAIIDIARKREASAESLNAIQMLAVEAIATMDELAKQTLKSNQDNS